MQLKIKEKLKNKDILLISHVVLGYPTLELAEKSVSAMVNAGVDIIELQIPFSDPMADGPFFTQANQESVKSGLSVHECFRFASQVTEANKGTSFIFMTYYNILFKCGVDNFVRRSLDSGVSGIIVPDLPIEEATDYIKACSKYNIDPIFMYTPTSTAKRMDLIAEYARGFTYCQARLGVTGKHTSFDSSVTEYIKRCRKHSKIPIAMGFGIQNKEDIDFLTGKVDIAICCTQAVRILKNEGIEKMEEFLKSLRATKN